jgi:hypothetical protein
MRNRNKKYMRFFQDKKNIDLKIKDLELKDLKRTHTHFFTSAYKKGIILGIVPVSLCVA